MTVSNQKLNPWFSMWTQPRATIQQIVDDNSTQFVIRLAMILGILEVLNRTYMNSSGDILNLPQILGLAVFFGPIAGIIGLYVSSAIVHWTGHFLGGHGSVQNIRAALTWGMVPAILGGLLWIPQLMIGGREIFTTATPMLDAHPYHWNWLFFISAIELVIIVWSFVVTVKCLGQVQGFSAWKAFANLVLPSLLIGLVVVGFVGALVIIGSSM